MSQGLPQSLMSEGISHMRHHLWRHRASPIFQLYFEPRTSGHCTTHLGHCATLSGTLRNTLGHCTTHVGHCKTPLRYCATHLGCWATHLRHLRYCATQVGRCATCLGHYATHSLRNTPGTLCNIPEHCATHLGHNTTHLGHCATHSRTLRSTHGSFRNKLRTLCSISHSGFKGVTAAIHFQWIIPVRDGSIFWGILLVGDTSAFWGIILVGDISAFLLVQCLNKRITGVYWFVWLDLCH